MCWRWLDTGTCPVSGADGGRQQSTLHCALIGPSALGHGDALRKPGIRDDWRAERRAERDVERWPSIDCTRVLRPHRCRRREREGHLDG